MTGTHHSRAAVRQTTRAGMNSVTTEIYEAAFRNSKLLVAAGRWPGHHNRGIILARGLSRVWSTAGVTAWSAGRGRPVRRDGRPARRAGGAGAGWRGRCSGPWCLGRLGRRRAASPGSIRCGVRCSG